MSLQPSARLCDSSSWRGSHFQYTICFESTVTTRRLTSQRVGHGMSKKSGGMDSRGSTSVMKYGFGLPLFASSFIDRLNHQEHSPWGSVLDFRSDRLRETTQALCILQLAREIQNLPTHLALRAAGFLSHQHQARARNNPGHDPPLPATAQSLREKSIGDA
jgi:hypothetical protein